MFAALCTLTAGCADDFKTVLNDKYYEDDTPSREPDITEQTLTLGSYNLWISGKGTGDYLWTNRRTVLAQSIVKIPSSIPAAPSFLLCLQLKESSPISRTECFITRRHMTIGTASIRTSVSI